MSNNYDSILKMATIKCQSNLQSPNNTKNNFSKLYPFTTENISGYVDFFELDDHSILTVGSSGDQTINAFLKGARSVTQFDINPFAEYYYYLKIAMILCLDYNEFIEILLNNSKCESTYYDSLSMETFEKISSTLKNVNSESFKFWSELLKTFPSMNIKNSMFQDDRRFLLIKKCNLYLQNEQWYSQAKETLKNKQPSFLCGDIRNIKITKLYDNIWLSNVAAYFKSKDKKSLYENVKKMLNDNGSLLMEYIYIYNPFLNNKYPEYKNYESKIITIEGSEGIDKADLKDAVLIYHKTRNDCISNRNR